MKFGEVLHVSQLQVGDVVRALRGPLERSPNAPAISYAQRDGSAVIVVNTRGWRCSAIGGVEDYRQGFDTTTVYKVDDDYVYLVRPYLHIGNDGMLGACGIEHMSFSRCHGGYWYELLSTRR